MKKAYLSYSLLAILLVFSCSKPKDFYDELGQGAYLTLVKVNNTNLNALQPTSNVGMVVGSYGVPVESVNLYVSSTPTNDATKWKLIKNVPFTGEATVEATNAQIVAALGITTAIAPGTVFYMYNEAVTKDGRKFSMANTSQVDLEGQPAFNAALQWRATVVCPYTSGPFDNKTYKIVTDEWADFAVGDPITVVLGPLQNQITLQGVFPTDTQHKDLVITIDPTSGAATVPRYNYGGYGSSTTTYTAGTVGTSNFVFSCTQTIDLTLNHKTAAGGDQGNYRLVLKP